MPYIDMKLPYCNHCWHLWLPKLEAGQVAVKPINFQVTLAGKRARPKVCPNCKTPNWDQRRKYKKHAPRKPNVPMHQRIARAKTMSGAEIFEQVMKTVIKK